ncbi:MAG: class I SAM-dependent methyltransferase [Verrucomicrobiota bacterium]
MAIPDNTSRFSDRVENYIKYRPSYPSAVVDFLKNTNRLKRGAVIADIGSGTGKLSEVFLEQGFPVIGVEPNREMRQAAESLLSEYSKFESMDGTAETTRLPRDSCDLIICGQAFHWFDIPQTRKEWQRILAPSGWVVLIWNERDVNSAFLADYEKFLDFHARSYAEVNHRNIEDTTLERFFHPNSMELEEFSNDQLFDFPALLGRYLSSSYAYSSSEPEFETAVHALRSLFEIHQTNDRVRFDYRTRIYTGQLPD